MEIPWGSYGIQLIGYNQTNQTMGVAKNPLAYQGFTLATKGSNRILR